MEWTAELDKSITELHAKRLGNAFIAKWLHLNPSHVRARLVALGLVKPRSSDPASRPAATSKGALAGLPDSARTADTAEDADEDDMVRIDGCPRGHLLSERRIASIYQNVGRGY